MLSRHAELDQQGGYVPSTLQAELIVALLRAALVGMSSDDNRKPQAGIGIEATNVATAQDKPREPIARER